MLAVTALIKTYVTEPGNVSAALIEKLKNQLLTTDQIEMYIQIRGEINRRQYLLKCLNSAITKHMAGRPNSDLTTQSGENGMNQSMTDMELLDLQPTTTFEAR